MQMFENKNVVVQLWLLLLYFFHIHEMDYESNGMALKIGYHSITSEKWKDLEFFCAFFEPSDPRIYNLKAYQ